ncbi:MAG: hypothetical protein HUJ63_03760 [Enterococcus sp.]|nr:hypothetical protein [Enterococcus sp.]
MKNRSYLEDSIMHYGRKGMKWHKNIFTGETYAYPSKEDMQAELTNQTLIDGLKKYGFGDHTNDPEATTDSLDTDDSNDSAFDKLVASGKDLLGILFAGGYDETEKYKYGRTGLPGSIRVVKK